MVSHLFVNYWNQSLMDCNFLRSSLFREILWFEIKRQMLTFSIQTQAKKFELEKITFFKACARYFLSNFYFFTK